MRPTMNKRADGFTLIELLTVLGLIGIMVAIAVPSFASFISNYRATAAVNDLLQAVTLTRTEALKRGTYVTVTPTGGDWRAGWTVSTLLSDGTTRVIFNHDALPSSINIAAPPTSGGVFGGANYVGFDGTGYPRVSTTVRPRPTLTGGIVITDKTGSATNVRVLCLGLMGRPRIVKLPANVTTTTETCLSG